MATQLESAKICLDRVTSNRIYQFSFYLISYGRSSQKRVLFLNRISNFTTLYNFQIVYVARNPKDVAVSFFHHYRHIVGYEGTQTDFTEAFLQDQIIYAPFNDHVLDFWKIRDEPNILFLFYEDMKTNMAKMVIEAMKFLGKNYTKQQIDELCKHLSVDSMRANPSCNNDSLVMLAKSLNENGKTAGDFMFIRKGEVGSFKQEFSIETDKRFENFMQRTTLHSYHFSFKI